jgi:hypothetical protein
MFAAILPAFLGVILYFMDQQVFDLCTYTGEQLFYLQITAVIVNRKDNKLAKGAGYHLDLFVLSFLVLLVGYLGECSGVRASLLHRPANLCGCHRHVSQPCERIENTVNGPGTRRGDAVCWHHVCKFDAHCIDMALQ